MALSINCQAAPVLTIKAVSPAASMVAKVAPPPICSEALPSRVIFFASLLVFFTRSRAPTGTVATAGRLTTMSAVLAPTRIRSPLVKSAAVRVVSAAAARVSRRGPSSAKLASLTRPVVAAGYRAVLSDNDL